MRKIIYALCAVLLMTGCGKKLVDNVMNTPTKKVEALLSKYQKLDQDVLDDLDKIVAEEERFTTLDRKNYRELMKRHYQSLAYKIVDEEIDGNHSLVTVEIEVTDYTNIKNIGDLTKKTDNDNSLTENTLDTIKDLINEMAKSTDRIKYTLEISASKHDDEWVVDPLTDENIKKIHGIYKN